jgi:hypothetical protein
MIDTIALVLGHALLGAALLRLALRVDVDDDPLIARLTAEVAASRKSKKQQRRASESSSSDDSVVG